MKFPCKLTSELPQNRYQNSLKTQSMEFSYNPPQIKTNLTLLKPGSASRLASPPPSAMAPSGMVGNMGGGCEGAGAEGGASDLDRSWSVSSLIWASRLLSITGGVCCGLLDIISVCITSCCCSSCSCWSCTSCPEAIRLPCNCNAAARVELCNHHCCAFGS